MAVIPRLRRRSRPPAMTVVEHLDELRRRLILAVIAVALATVAGWFLYRPVFDLLTNPFCDFIRAHPSLSIRSGPHTACGLAYTGVLEPFVVKLKVAVFTGFAIALPIVLYQLWMFITPGLMPRERRTCCATRKTAPLSTPPEKQTPTGSAAGTVRSHLATSSARAPT